MSTKLGSHADRSCTWEWRQAGSDSHENWDRMLLVECREKREEKRVRNRKSERVRNKASVTLAAFMSKSIYPTWTGGGSGGGKGWRCCGRSGRAG